METFAILETFVILDHNRVMPFSISISSPACSPISISETKVTFRKEGVEIDELWHLKSEKKFWKENVIKKQIEKLKHLWYSGQELLF